MWLWGQAPSPPVAGGVGEDTPGQGCVPLSVRHWAEAAEPGAPRETTEELALRGLPHAQGEGPALGGEGDGGVRLLFAGSAELTRPRTLQQKSFMGWGLGGASIFPPAASRSALLLLASGQEGRAEACRDVRLLWSLAMRLWLRSPPREREAALSGRLRFGPRALGAEEDGFGVLPGGREEPFTASTGIAALGMKGPSGFLKWYWTFSQPGKVTGLATPDGQPSSARSKVVFRSRTGSAAGVQQFWAADVVRGTRVLVTVEGQALGTQDGTRWDVACAALGVP